MPVKKGIPKNKEPKSSEPMMNENLDEVRDAEEDPIAVIDQAIREIEEEHGKVLAFWKFPEYQQHQRGRWWYVIAIVLSLLLISVSILNNNILFAIIIVIADIIIFLQAKNHPMDMIFVITEDGILLHHKFYPYRDLQYFWIAYHPPMVKTLYFKAKSGFRPEIGVSLEDQDPLEVREILLNFIDENLDEEDEKTSDALSRLLKI